MRSKSYIKRMIALVLSVIVAFFCFGIQTFAATAEETAYKNSLKSAGFPDIYLDKLWAMHQAHPNWNFEPFVTGIDWDTAVAQESSKSRCLVYINPTEMSATRLYRSQSEGSYSTSMKLGFEYKVRDGNNSKQIGWVDASPMAVAYYMNPYTFIGNEITIMQFESLEWNFTDVAQAEPIIETMLTGTFMSKTRNSANANYVDDSGNITYINTSGAQVTASITFANAICQAAKDNNINPCYLTSKILGEVSTSGSGSTTGTVSGYTGYYNYLNIGAYDSSTGGAIYNGLKYAKNQGWNTPMAAITGGARYIASAYIAKGQNTAYLQKFNVTSRNTYENQYMTAVNGVCNTTYSTYKGYKTNGILDSVKTFYIPVFKNMPTSLSSGIVTSGYANTATVNGDNINIRKDAGINYATNGVLSKGQTVTIYGGFREQHVAYDPSYGSTDSTYYRMYVPLWYKIGDSKFSVEDYIDTTATATIEVGKTHQFKYKLSSGSETPRFMSWDTRIATVDANGNIKGISPGSTKVVAYLMNGSFAVINVRVNADSSSPSLISSPIYAVNNTSSYISKISAGTTVSTFLNGLNEKSYVSITKEGKALAGTDLITTGCVVSLMNGSSVVKQYTVVITGDIGTKVGDGKVTISDLLAIRDELLSTSGILSGATLSAADVNADGKVTISDLLAIRDYLLGTKPITPQAY